MSIWCAPLTNSTSPASVTDDGQEMGLVALNGKHAVTDLTGPRRSGERRMFSQYMRVFRWKYSAATREGSPNDLELADAGKPLFFHHIPKTAGSSLIEAIRMMIRPELAVSDNGNLPRPYVDALVTEGLKPGHFIFGHPGPGAASTLRGKAKIITLLREPREHAISNFLHLLREPENVLHKPAVELGFRNFLLAYPNHVIFQTSSLQIGISAQPVGRAEELIDHLPQIFRYLDEMCLVGIVGGTHGFMAHLAEIMGWSIIPRFPHLNRADVAPELHTQLLEQLDELHDHPELSVLFAAEHTVYRKAMTISARANDRLITRRMMEGRAVTLDSSLVAYQSPQGNVVLGENFGRIERRASGKLSWWTLHRRTSQIFVSAGRAPNRRMDITVLVWHWVIPDSVAFFAGPRQLDVSIRPGPDGTGELSVDLGGLRWAPGRFVELTLHLWGGVPETSPFYPAVSLTDFRLIGDGEYEVPV
jgi:hypothetical protein